MSTVIFFNFCISGLILLIINSYFKRGLALTVNFFLFVFMLTFINAGTQSLRLISIPANTNTNLLNIFHATFSTAIWVLVFYLAWHIGEKTIARIAYVKVRVFPLILYTAITVAALVYAVEITAANIGWLGIPQAINDGCYLGLPDITRRLFYFSAYFFAAYFLITVSEYKKKEWKTIFFVLPFLHTWVIQFFGKGYPQIIEESFVLLALFLLAFVSPLRFDYSGVNLPEVKLRIRSRLIELLPMLVVVMLLFILSFIDLIKIQNPRLLASLLPICFLVLLSIPRIPLPLIILLNIVCFLIFKKLAIFAAVPALLLVLFQLAGQLRFNKKDSLSS